MKLHCPHCEEVLKTKDAIIGAITKCHVCNKSSCLGGFKQWLAVAIIAFVCFFLSVVIFESFDKPEKIIISTALSLIALLIAMLLLIRPVKYDKLW